MNLDKGSASYLICYDLMTSYLVEGGNAETIHVRTRTLNHNCPYLSIHKS